MTKKLGAEKQSGKKMVGEINATDLKKEIEKLKKISRQLEEEKEKLGGPALKSSKLGGTKDKQMVGGVKLNDDQRADVLRKALSTPEGWIALAQAVKNRPNQKQALGDVRRLFIKWFGNDPNKINTMMAKLQIVMSEV